MATYNFLNKTGLELVWSKIKGLIKQSDWNEADSTDDAFIQNKPSIKAGEGENSIIEGQIDNTEARTWTIYITGDAKSNTFTYTTQDDMSTMSSSLGAHSVYINNASSSARKIQRIESIDKTNNIIVFKDYVSSVALNNAEAIIYYHYKYAEGECSHSEGIYNIAANRGSHAEGSGTVANGIGAHAEGNFTSALGNYSHAEGGNTYATTYSHAEGSSTIALGSTTIPQHVEGKYNIPDYNQTYAHIVGNGTSSARSNAYTLDWSGNGVYAGKLTVGAGPMANMDVATKQYVDAAAAKEVVIVNLTYDSTTDTYSADKTTEEICNFASSGGIVTCYSARTTAFYNLFSYGAFPDGSTHATFVAVTLDDNFVYNDIIHITHTEAQGENVSFETYEEEIPLPSTSTPLANGTAAIGTSTNYARADHVHPKITQTLSMSSNVITLTGSDGTTSSITLPVWDGSISEVTS